MKTAFYALLNSDDSQNAKTPALEQFFADPKVIELLAHPSRAFPPPSQQTKTAFETKTSAINVTPSSSTRYNIKEVKEDALWLSAEAKIDEITALRVVLEECQERPSAQLLGRLSDEEMASIQEAAGTNQASAALLSFPNSDTILEDFNSQKNRRLRILSTYLSERRNLLQCVNIVCQKSLYSGPQAPGGGKVKDSQIPESWVQKIGNSLVPAMGDPDQWIVEALSAIEITANSLHAGSGWFKGDDGCEIVETKWVNSQFMEISSAMEIIFQIVDVQASLPSSAIVLRWLKLVEQFKFFDQFATEDSTTEALLLPIRSAVALISLSMLSTGPCLAYLRTTEDPNVSLDAPQDAPYILNLNTITQVHMSMVGASEFVNAAPMVLAWADILQALVGRVTERAAQSASRDSEDLSHSYAVDDQISLVKDVYEETVVKMLKYPEGVEDVVQSLAASAVDGGQVFQSLADLAVRFGGYVFQSSCSFQRFSQEIGSLQLSIDQSCPTRSFILFERLLTGVTGHRILTSLPLLERECDLQSLI